MEIAELFWELRNLRVTILPRISAGGQLGANKIGKRTDAPASVMMHFRSEFGLLELGGREVWTDGERAPIILYSGGESRVINNTSDAAN